MKRLLPALAVCVALGGCASSGFFRRPTEDDAGGFFDRFLGCGDGGGALWWIGLAGGISLLAGVYNVTRGRPGFTSIALGIGLCTANFLILEYAAALFIPVVLVTSAGSAWLAWRTLRNVDGTSAVRRLWSRLRGIPAGADAPVAGGAPAVEVTP